MVEGNIKVTNIEHEMKQSYLDYAMSVIVSRALPDARDGLKPVHRRILFSMQDLNNFHNQPYRKSARIVGDVLGKYHPHGDSSVYDAMVRLAQPFSMRHCLVDGQGNFGSVDGDSAAAMRYTEVRLTEYGEQMLTDLEKNTVDFMPNFDDSLQEPTVLPASVPNLLVNGSSGIAVGMATNIPPHNLGELCQAVSYLIDNPDATTDELMQYVPGPDFPTGATIIGKEGIRSAYATGKGHIVIQAKAHFDETSSGRRQIIITELPYQCNKAELIKRIAQLVKDKRITGISELRDESDRQGLRVVIDLKRDAQPRQLLNNLYKLTPLQTGFGINMLALVNGEPRVLSLKDALEVFIAFRHDVIVRRTNFDLKIARDRAHILEGLMIALDHLDEIIKIIRESKNVDEARSELMTKFELSKVQAQAILDMRLRALSSLERQAVFDEHAALVAKIADLEDLVSNNARILKVVKEEADKTGAKFGNPRMTEISNEDNADFNEEDLIPHQSMVITLSDRGFIKRVSTSTYVAQHRGGVGKTAMTTREEDNIRLVIEADTHDTILYFTDSGRVFSNKCYTLPQDMNRTGKGISIVNLIPLKDGEKVTEIVDVAEFKEEQFLVMACSNGEVKKVKLVDFQKLRSTGVIAYDLPKGSKLIAAAIVDPDDYIIMASEAGQSIKFNENEIRTSLRSSGGVSGFKLGFNDKAISMSKVKENGFLMVITTQGHGKITPLDKYPEQHRAGLGVRTFHITSKTGPLVDAMVVTRESDVMLISSNGVMTRTPVTEDNPKQGITIQGRSTQGVKIMTLNEGDTVACITSIEPGDEISNDPVADNAAEDTPDNEDTKETTTKARSKKNTKKSSK